MKLDKFLGIIIRIPLYLLFIVIMPLMYVVGLGITLSFKETNESIKELFR